VWPGVGRLESRPYVRPYSLCIRLCVVVVVVSVVAVVSLVCVELTIGSGVVIVVVVVVVSGVSVTLTDDVDPCGRLFTLVFVPTVDALPVPGALLLV